MGDSIFSPISWHKVLIAVKEQCGYEGENLVMLSVDDMNAADISTSCHLLGELGFIRTTTWESSDHTVYYPVSITPKGLKFLDEEFEPFWKWAQGSALAVVKKSTGIDFSPLIDLVDQWRKKYSA